MEMTMSPVRFADLEGEWAGTHRLRLSPDAPVRESPSSATLAAAAGGRFATLRYTWADGGKPQDGLLLIAASAGKGPADVAWVDSWHMGDAALLCGNEPGLGEIVNALGSYAAPPGPDWGWRTVIRAGTPDTFDLLMYNITPEGEQMLAVEVAYARKP